MLSVTLKMYLFAGEERYSAAVRLEGWLKPLQWPCFSHQYLLGVLLELRSSSRAKEHWKVPW